MPPSTQTLVGYLRSLIVRERTAAVTDCDLLDRFRDGRDGEAFSALLQKHGPRVLGVARRVVRDQQSAEDVFQATFLLLARQAHTVRRADAVGAWLSQTAFRLALRVRRSQQTRHQKESLSPTRPVPSPLDDVSARELLAILDEELDALPDNYRWPVVLCCLDGLSQEEAARYLNWAPRTVRGRLERGRERLRRRLAARGLALTAVLATALVADSAAALSPTLWESTRAAALAGIGGSPAVTSLVTGALRMIWLKQLKAVGLGLLVVLLAGVGVMVMLPSGGPLPAQPPGPRADVPADKPTEPLPEGAVMRLGTLKQRAVGAKVAFSGDGKSVVGVRGGRYVAVWDAETGKPRESREVPGDDWGQAALSPNGDVMAVEGEFRGALIVYDLKSGKELHKLELPPSGHVYPVTFSPDGKHVAAVGNGRGVRHVRAWRVADGKEVFSRDVKNDVSSDKLVFTPDGTRLLASFTSVVDQGTYCWDFPGGELVWQNKQFVPPSLAFAGDKIVSTADDKFRVIDLTTGEPAKIDNLPKLEWDNHIVATPDGKTLLVAGPDGVRAWDLAAGKERYLLKGAGEEMIVSPDGKTLLTNSGVLQRWDLATGKPLWADTWELGHGGEVLAVRISPDGKRLASASADGSVRLWDLTTGKTIHVWTGHEARRPVRLWRWMKAGVTALAMSRDGRLLLSAGSEGRLRVLDTTTGKVLHSLTLPDLDAGEGDRVIYRVAFTADGKSGLALFGAEGGFGVPVRPMAPLTDKVAVWDLETGEMTALHRMPGKSSGRSLALDARAVATVAGLVGTESGQPLRSLEGVEKEVNNEPLALSDDGRLVIGGCGKLKDYNGQKAIGPDGVRVWEAATGKTIAHLKTPSWVGQVGFAPDSRFAVTHDLDGLHVWDLLTGESLLTRSMPEKVRSSNTAGTYASCFAFTPDGKRLATGHPDGNILVWELKLPDAKAEPLTAKEAASLWDDLKGDASKAWPAAWRLSAAPDVALPLLKEKLKPVLPAPAETTGKLLADLDSDSFAKRQAAVQGLKELGPRAEGALRQALKGEPSAEVRRQIEGLLETLANSARPLSSEEMREVRAVAVLSRIGDADTRRLLEDLTKGVDAAPLTREARAAGQTMH